MDFVTVCRIQSANALIGGAILLILPGPLLGLFLTMSPPTELVGRMLGGILFARGVMGPLGWVLAALFAVNVVSWLGTLQKR